MSLQYPKVEDVEVFQDKPMSWHVRMSFGNFKVNRTHILQVCSVIHALLFFQGFNNTIAGMERSITLEPVKNWYNVTFDVAFWVVMHLFVRGAFQDIRVTFFLNPLPFANASCHRPKKT